MNPQIQIKGANAEAFNSTLPELILCGPANCGKTFAILHKLQDLALNFPNARIAMVRKTRRSMNDSILETFEGGVYPAKYLASRILDRGSRTNYTYPNGSRIHVFGMDAPDKLLGSRWDIIYVNECTELTEAEWGQLGTRLLTHNTPFNQLIGDCNPASKGQEHWIWKRHKRGELPLMYSDHTLNPSTTASDLKRLDTARGDLRRRFFLSGPESWVALPTEGKLFKPEWFVGKYIKALPSGGKWARGWDTASGESEDADESAGVLMRRGAFDGKDDTIIIADCIAGRWGPHARNERMRLTAEADKKYEATGYFGKGFGQGVDMNLSILQALKGYSMWAAKEKGSKYFRADPLAGMCQAGDVYILEAEWNHGFVMELCEFTGEEGGKDNKVDAASLTANQLFRWS
jgi:predicted phage terminase large subunit-like protein